MEKDLTLFDFTYIDNKSDKTLFLFHGTGGTKEDFLFLDTLLDKKWNLVGLQGNVSESGSPRFFKRVAIGVFDQASIKIELDKLYKFLIAWEKKYLTSNHRTAFMGYSNGANMILAGVFRHPELFQNAILLHAHLPFEVSDLQLDLPNTKILLTLGKGDFYVPEQSQTELISALQTRHAILTLKKYDYGHQITDEEMNDVVMYLRENA